MHDPVEIAKMLIVSLPNLLEDTRKASLAYIKSEEERISKLLGENSLTFLREDDIPKKQ